MARLLLTRGAAVDLGGAGGGTPLCVAAGRGTRTSFACSWSAALTSTGRTSTAGRPCSPPAASGAPTPRSSSCSTAQTSSWTMWAAATRSSPPARRGRRSTSSASCSTGGPPQMGRPGRRSRWPRPAKLATWSSPSCSWTAGRPWTGPPGAACAPLHFACLHGCDPALVRLLLARGASPSPVSADGATPLQLAIQNADASVVELLLQAGGLGPPGLRRRDAPHGPGLPLP